MMRISSLDNIRSVLPGIALVPEIEQGFVAYSRGHAVVPPVGELIFKHPPGEVHIKYGYIEGEEYYVIKIASGFQGNRMLGLPSSNGMMLLFRQRTGEPVAVLLDEGYLTDVRTAVAGAIAAKHLAPRQVSRIGIAGTGVQARLQLQHLETVTDCREVLAFGRDQSKLEQYARDMAEHGFVVECTKAANELLERCNLIVTTTAATAPILTGRARPGTHITAMGSDTREKQELDAALLAAADVIVADSIEQCLERGEIHQALQRKAIALDGIVELGSIICGDVAGRTSDEQVTVADLTGVAVQDMQIARTVFAALA